MDYLDRFHGLLVDLGDEVPTLIAGDFNQRIRVAATPSAVADRLGEALGRSVP